jgi:hypothetical protein
MVIVLSSVSDRFLQVGNEYTYAKVASAVVEPASRGIHQSSRIQLLDPVCQLKLGIIAGNLAPSLIVNDL